jgi:glycosyltransferase involved in cell wall biosynthesis
MKVAIVHPWFLEQGGGEKVVEVLAAMYPKADLFALSARESYIPASLRGRTIYTSNLDKAIACFFRLKRASFMPLFPWAVEGLNVSNYDLIVSSCGAAVMGVNPDQDSVHMSYVHSPQRAWWDLYASRQAEMSGLQRQLFVLAATYMRSWEFNAMQRVDHVISNSQYIAKRVHKYFRRESSVIYPPVNTSPGYCSGQPGEYYLSLSRLDKDKRIDLVIGACNRLKRKLLIGGTGREEKRLKALAGPTIDFLGRVPDASLPALFADCRALLFAADEDFGIVPVEVQSYGRPVVAYGHGGSLETVRVNDPEGRPDTGVFFAEQSVESVTDAIRRFERIENRFRPELIQSHAREFDTTVFERRFRGLVETLTNESHSDVFPEQLVPLYYRDHKASTEWRPRGRRLPVGTLPHFAPSGSRYSE